MHAVLRILVRTQFLSEEIADELNGEFGSPLLALHHAGFDDVEVANTLSEALAIPVDIAFVSDDVMDLVESRVIAEKLCMPLQREGKRRLLLGMVDPTDVDLVDMIRFETNLDVVPRVLPLSVYRRLSGFDGEESSPIVRLTYLLLVDAIKTHREVTVLENDPHDGLTTTGMDTVPPPVGDGMVQRLRLMAGVPEGPGIGGIILTSGPERLFFFMAEFAVDDRRVVLTLMTRADFEDRFGFVDV